MLKQIVVGLGALLLLAAPVSSAQAALLAKVEADVDGSGRKELVELTGERKIPGSNYYSHLWILVKNEEGNMLTAWKADLDGGYYCLLEKMPVNAKAEKKAPEKGKKVSGKEKKTAETEKKSINDKNDTEKRFEELLESLKEETDTGKEKGKVSGKPHDRILLMAAKGGKNAAVNWRILDFSDRKQVREVFSGADSMGIAAKAEYKPDYLFTVETMLPEEAGPGEKKSFSGNAKNVLRIYNEDGSVAKPYLRPLITEVASLTTLGGRLFTEQNVLAANSRDLLGRLAVRWAHKEDRWIPEEIRLTDTMDELTGSDDANQPAGAGSWKLYPRRAFVGDRVISRPVVAVEEKPELQNKINEKLDLWFAKAPEEDERAFQVKFAGTKLLSLELGRRNKKGEVIRELYNFNMQSGDLIKLEDMFNTKSPDFLKVINLTGKPADRFPAGRPVFWHFTGKHFVLQDRLLAEGFQDEEAIRMAVLEKNDLLPFLKDKTMIEK